MSTQIKLDRDAFLVWQGTMSEEIKITLSNTMIQEFAQKHIKGDFSKIINALDFSKSKITEGFKEEIKGYFDKEYNYTSREETPP